MADEYPSRYGLRSSPLKSLPPTPPRIRPASPKKFTSPQGQTQRTLFKSKDESVDPLTSLSTRKLSYETLSGTSSSSLFGSTQSISTSSSSAIGGRSLRENGRYYSVPSACYIARSRSSTNLSEVPFGEKQKSTLVSTINTPVHPPPPLPPRIKPANSTSDESIRWAGERPSRGLTRSLATVRLLPAAKEELEAIASTNEKNIEEQKRDSVQGKSRRLLSHSISVACLKQESYQGPSRPAIRIRPASPSRIAKSNSGLLRSYSSVDIGGASVASKLDNSVISRGESILPQSSQSKAGRAITRVVSATTIFPSKQEAICAENTSQEVSSCIPSGDLNSDTQIVLPSCLDERACLPLKTTATSLPLIDTAETGSIIEKDINDAIPHQPTVTASLKRHHLPSGMDNDHVHDFLNSPLKLKTSTLLSTPNTAMPSASFFLRDDVVTPEATTNLNRTESGMSSGASEKTPKPARRPKKMRRLEMENDEVDEEAREYAFESSQSTSWPRARNSPCKVMTTSKVDYATRTVRPIQMEKMEEEPKKDDSVNCFPIAQAKLQDAPSKSALRLGNPSKICRNVQFAHVDVYLFERAQGFFSVPTTGEICLGMEPRHFDKEYHRLDGREDEVEDDERVSKGEIQSFARVRLPALSSPRRLPLPGEKQTTRIIEALPAKQRSRLLKTNGVKISRDSLLPQENDSIRKSRRECGCSCVGGRCLPETCECSKDGIPCQVDSEDEQFPCNCRSDSCKNVEGRIEFNHMYVYQHWKSTVARLKVWERLGDDSLGSPSHIRFPDEDGDAPKYNATSYLATPPPVIYQPSMAASTSDTPARSVFTASLEPMCTPPMVQHRTNEGIGNVERAPGDRSDRSHRRFPVTPVYKKYAIGGEKASRESSLARTAMFKAATTADNALSPTNDTTCDDDLNESMDTSVYATPPESNTPIAAPLSSYDVVSDSSCLSPRKFPAVRSLL